MKKNIIINLLGALLIFSCTKDKEDTNLAPVVDFFYTDQIDHFVLTSTATDPEEDPLSYEWSSISELITIQNANSSSASFILPQLTESTEITIDLTVCDGDKCGTASQTILLPEYTEIRKWGLGRDLEAEQSNNVDYEWYMDQMNTGVHSYVNCGPTSVTMALKWFDEEFSGTPEDARNTYVSSGGWWYTSDIINYLNLYSANNYTIYLSDLDLLMDELDNGNILILCLDMFYIRSSTVDEWHIDKFYATNSEGWGHFIVIKGYKIVDGNILYEAYDPYCFGVSYPDQTLKGKDRYYRSEDLDIATNIWWDNAIVISKSTDKSTNAVDINKIEHNFGR